MVMVVGSHHQVLGLLELPFRVAPPSLPAGPGHIINWAAAGSPGGPGQGADRDTPYLPCTGDWILATDYSLTWQRGLEATTKASSERLVVTRGQVLKIRRKKS